MREIDEHINKKVKHAPRNSRRINRHDVYDILDDRSKLIPFSKESILQDIASQNLAGKPCLQASPTALMQGKLEFKAHAFHQKQ